MIELVLFETEGITTLPDADTVNVLKEMAERHTLTYTVHLPGDTWMGHEDESVWRQSVDKCLRVIEVTAPLSPFTYVVHFHGDSRGEKPSRDLTRWTDDHQRSVERLLQNINARDFCVETLDYEHNLTPEGGEMTRSDCSGGSSVDSTAVDMNPVLLKPSTDTGAQVVLHGHPLGNREAKEYFSGTDHIYEKALTSLERLRALYSLIIMEGAGFCAEVNLRARDLVNFRMAHAADAPVILVADIDRGGVFVQVIRNAGCNPGRRQRTCGRYHY